MGDDTGNMGDNGRQAPATTGDGQRLTYAEIAARLGISGEAARILVRRRGWQRSMPNHPRGLTVVLVPDDALADEDWRRAPLQCRTHRRQRATHRADRPYSRRQAST